eukprot:COSAG01_NODE_2292_length_7969_cov_3.362262_1_plen_208_part_00
MSSCGTTLLIGAKSSCSTLKGRDNSVLGEESMLLRAAAATERGHQAAAAGGDEAAVRRRRSGPMARCAEARGARRESIVGRLLSLVAPPAGSAQCGRCVSGCVWLPAAAAAAARALLGLAADHAFFLSCLRLPMHQRELPHAQGYLLFATSSCGANVSGHCAPQHRSNNAVIWDAYDMWLFQGSEAWLQCGVVHHSYVLLVCRKFWF